MKRVAVFLLISLGWLHLHGQELDKTFYLLGTLEDYCGRHYPKNNPFEHNFIMVLYKNRIGEVKRIEEIVGKKFSKTKAKNDCRNCEDFYQLNSRALSNKINDFYSFEKRTMKDIMGFHFYTGTLLCDKISTATEMQQLSFIAGLFLTNGSIQEDIYKITLYNSPERFECIKNLLLKLGTEITVEKINKGEIPVGYFLEFKPSEKVKQIMENEIKRKSELEAQTS